ncbi:MAG: type secretion protein [Blastocatellia bacterium]|jgi:type III secretion protein V|nr:type secretion protein [Blastocatellia bacterium]
MDKFLKQLSGFWQAVRSGNVLRVMSRYSDLILPVALMLAISTLFIPIPTPLISVLVVINLSLSLIVLATSLYISSPIQLTSYPTILLLTTLFRLCLSVSVARSILERAYAGEVIETLGKFTGGGNVIVGGVIFVMILVVQFIVVAKGSERVAEVAARFTLDAMPGKQMSIDADMRSGLLTQEQARQMRGSLQKESQLYGAMDGAMKFVKGDSIATIVIAMTNIVAGLAIGILYKDLKIGQALQKYTVMTIGDGLSAIISSILITVSAGIVVTRVAADEEHSNVGSDISLQLFDNPKPLFVAAALLLLLALIPGMHLPFLIIGGIVAALAVTLQRARQRAAREESERLAKTGAVNGRDELQPTFSVPLAVVVSSNLTPLIDKSTPSGLRFREELPKLRSSIYYDLGVMLPNVYISGNAPLKQDEYFIALKEVPVVYGMLKPDCVYVNDSAEHIKVFGLEGEDVLNPADLKPGSWIPAEQRPIAELAGLKVWEPAEVITLHLSRIMKKYSHEFIGIQESQALLDFAARGVPKLVEEVVPKVVTIHQFTDVLQRLVQEGISIRDIKTILDSLSEWGRIEKDTVMLTEYVRSSLKRYISFRYTEGRDTLFVYLLDPEIEDVIRGAVRRTSTGSFLSLDPSIAHDILEALRREIANLPPTAQKPVIITDMELRRFVRKMVELEFPTLAVLSYQELTPELNVQPVGRISMRPNPNAYMTGAATGNALPQTTALTENF